MMLMLKHQEIQVNGIRYVVIFLPWPCALKPSGEHRLNFRAIPRRAKVYSALPIWDHRPVLLLASDDGVGLYLSGKLHLDPILKTFVRADQ